MLFQQKRQKIPSTFLQDKYIVPPFSVFNTHQPYWRERLAKWRDLGVYIANGRIAGKAYDNRRMDKRKSGTQEHNGTSSFNPVVCEVVYKWFLPKDKHRILDPFAGGIVRGAVASILEHEYTGFDVNPVQVDSNYAEYAKVSEKYEIRGSAQWLKYDCRHYLSAEKYDLIFTCPPYYNLEVYSDLPEYLSTKATYAEFLEDYKQIIEHSYDLLNDDCFSVWVVSDVRDKITTEYYGFVADTIKIHQQAGFKFYNEIILYNDTGNLAITSGDYLNKARKVGRQHQNILVFFKGDPKHIKEKFGSVFEEA